MAKTIVYPLNNTVQYFDTEEDYLQIVKQNIKNLFLTNPGDRVIRRRKIGIPINKIFFENNREDAIEILRGSLQDNISKYFPTIRIDYVREIEIDANINTNKISIEVKFTDITINISDSIIITNN